MRPRLTTACPWDPYRSGQAPVGDPGRPIQARTCGQVRTTALLGGIGETDGSLSRNVMMRRMGGDGEVGRGLRLLSWLPGAGWVFYASFGES